MTKPAPLPPASFTARLLRQVALAAAEGHADNQHIWNDIPLGKRSLRESTSQGRKYNAVIPAELALYAPLFPQFDRLSERLDDEASRDLLASIIAYRLMGQRAVKLPLNTPEYHRMLADMDSRATASDLATSFRLGGLLADPLPLSTFDMRPLGWDLTLLGQADYAVAEFLLGRYRCGDIGATVGPGDVVIDCGAGWGGSVLHFADDVGPAGQVHAFDFEPGNLTLLDQALALNPQLQDRVEVTQSALWDQSDITLGFQANGPASRLTPLAAVAAKVGAVAGARIGAKNGAKAGTGANGQATVDTVTIDDYIHETALDRVDFIKMDIEGAEPKALRGARRTIQRFKPKLAISLDFQPHHYVEIPRLLAEYVPEYRFRLGHVSISQGDTILHAAVDPATSDQ